MLELKIIEDTKIKLNNMAKLLDDNTLLSEEGFRKIFGFIIRVSDKFEKYPILKDATVELAKNLRGITIMKPFNLDNVNNMCADLDLIIELNQEQKL